MSEDFQIDDKHTILYYSITPVEGMRLHGFI